MKKVLFVIALCVSVSLANAQNQNAPKTTTPPTPAPKVMKAPAAMPTRTVVKEAELLQPIKDNIAKDFTGAKLNVSFKIEAKGVVTYEVHVTAKDNVRWTLVYDKDGKFIKKEEMKMPQVKKPEVKKEVKEVKKTEAPKQ
jgi:hypothetical protein